MKKISTLFRKDPNDLGRVINEVNPENQWVFDGFGIPTRKFDGTACAIIDGELYKRYDAKINKKTGKRKEPPAGSIACQKPDEVTGHQPFWVKCDRDNPSEKYHWEAFDNLKDDEFPLIDFTFELCGPKINGNNENYKEHVLVPHGAEVLTNLTGYSFEEIKEYLTFYDIEGIVFHHDFDHRMCKIRKTDFGIHR